MSGPSEIALHSSFDEIEPQFHAALEESLAPDGPEALFDVVAAMDLPAGAQAVDVGCGRGQQSVELARRFGFEVLGIDPGDREGPPERELEAMPLPSASVTFAEGTAEHIPVGDGVTDLI